MSNNTGAKVVNQFYGPVNSNNINAGVGDNASTGIPSDVNRSKLSGSDIKEKVENLKGVLIHEAEDNCELEGTTILKHPRHYAELQMAQYQQHGESHLSEDPISREKMINSTENPTSDKLQPKDFFKRSKEHAPNSERYRKVLNDNKRKRVLDEISNVVGIIGPAGVGKSTLVKVLLNRIVGKENLYKTNFVFYAKLRDFKNNLKLNLFQFLMEKEAYESLLWMKDEEVRLAVIKHLAELDSVCILLDGLDETIINTDIKKNDMNIYGTELPENFILGLLSGKIFPKAKTIITSRPGPMLDLPKDYKPNFIVKIFGITPKGFQQICQDLCDDRAIATDVETKIKNQPDLHSYTIVPIHCILMVNCIYKYLIDPDTKPLPNNITDVFVLSYYFFTQAENVDKKPNEINIQDKNNLKKICYLAWSGMQTRQITFSDKDLREAGLTPKYISSFAVTKKSLKKRNRVDIIAQPTENCTYFSHLLFQEFFAALYCLCFMDIETFETTFFNSSQISSKRKELSSQNHVSGVNTQDLTSNHLLNVTKFLYGLSNFETFKTLSENFEIDQQEEHVNLLKKFLKSEASSLNDSDSEFKDVLRVCSWANENQDQVLVQQISNSLPEHLEMTGDILPSEALSFHHVTKARSKKFCLDIKANFIGDASFVLGKEMKSVLVKSSFIEIRIDYINNLNHEKAVHISNLIVDGVKEIKLDFCHLTEPVVSLITSQVSKLTKSVELKLSFNKNMGPDVFKHLCGCLRNVSFLNLSFCDITSEEIRMLSEAIMKSKDPKNRIKLNLSFNKNIGPAGFKHLCECLTKISVLNLSFCDITTEEIKLLTEAIMELKHPIELYLSCSKDVGPDGFTDLCKCLHNISYLDLSFCDITTDAIKEIGQAISKLDVQMQCLDVRDNLLDEKVKEEFGVKCNGKVSNLLI